MNCRFCKTELTNIFIDMINSPASNSYITKEQINEPEVFYPLRVYTCPHCFLVQIDEYKKTEAIFNKEYAYFSSYSRSWLAHAKKYTELMMARFGINNQSQVIELASNDGYLLQYFKEKNVPVLGIEPTENTAQVAINKGIETVVDFFSVSLAQKLVEQNIKADLLLGNNVLAHVPDIVDFVGGMKIILKENGIITMEFPHLLQLVENSQFDTIYHEHFSYLSFTTVQKIFAAQRLEIFDVEELTTHGGSLRIYAKHVENKLLSISASVFNMLEKENVHGMSELSYYDNFQQKALSIKLDLIDFLVTQYRNGKKVAAYGAAAKGNTMLNYCGIKHELIEFVIDANPHKQNKFLPASHIPIYAEEHLKQQKPDFVVVLPWNLKTEIIEQLSYIREWGGKFVTAIPKLDIF